jgi:hypothetical protein
MFEFGLYAVFMFFFYLLLLPLFGFLIGVAVYVGTPYLAGVALACVAHKVFHGSFFDLGVFWFVALAWSVAIVHMRQILKTVLEIEHSWHEGHYLAATNVLLMGKPYRKLKRATAI